MNPNPDHLSSVELRVLAQLRREIFIILEGFLILGGNPNHLVGVVTRISPQLPVNLPN